MSNVANVANDRHVRNQTRQADIEYICRYFQSVPSHAQTIQGQIAQLVRMVQTVAMERNRLRSEVRQLRRMLERMQAEQRCQRRQGFRDYDREDSGSDGAF